MAIVQLLTVQSIDGYVLENLREQHPTIYEAISAMKDKATFLLSEDTSLTMLIDGIENERESTTCLTEAAPSTSGIISGMLRLHLIDEIVAYTAPVMLGAGRGLYQRDIPKTAWKCVLTQVSKDGTVKTVFRKIAPKCKMDLHNDKMNLRLYALKYSLIKLF